MCVAHQARVAPFLDIAAAAAHFHGVAGDLARIAAGAELDQRREHAHQRIGIGLASVGAAQRLGRLEHHGAGLLGGQRKLEQLAAHQRHVQQALAKGPALARDELALGQGAAHQAGRAHAVGQARVVDHVGHLHKAPAELAH